jgi:hypothetical protein
VKNVLRSSSSYQLASLLLLAINGSASVLYVDVNGTNPTPPYTNWAIAATNIQDAVDLANAGDTVLVTNGVYATGGRKWFDSGTNRVTLTNSITLQSVNGPAVTWIVGNRVPGIGQALTNAVRCVAIGSSAVLSGFTLTNGEAGTGNYPNGGGVMQTSSISAAGTVTNCVLAGNLATNSVGGGAYRVILVNCQISGNSSGSGGGACSCTLLNCTIVSNTATSGGGVFGGSVYGPSVLSNCTLMGNSAGNGGGAYGCALTNSALIGNKASTYGGGAYGGTLANCLLAGNSAGSRGGGSYSASLVNCTVATNSSTIQGGGVDESQAVRNCIIYYNSAPFGPDINGGGAFTNCCTTSLPGFGANNFTNAPLFMNLNGADFHLQSNSPCINSGDNHFVSNTVDLDGNPRIRGGTVDLGAYEFQNPASAISYAWLQQYGVPTDGSSDFADFDGDGTSNWQEWIAGTNPTNFLSVLKLLSVSTGASGITVNWQSVANRTYYLQRSTNLSSPPAFSSIGSNIVGHAATTSLEDTTATNAGPYFYRVGVQQ